MTHQEAIMLGTQKFLENNLDLVLKAIERGVNNSIPEIAAQVGLLMSARLGKFLNDNHKDIINVSHEMIEKELLGKLRSRVTIEKDQPPAFEIPKRKDSDA